MDAQHFNNLKKRECTIKTWGQLQIVTAI